MSPPSPSPRASAQPWRGSPLQHPRASDPPLASGPSPPRSPAARAFLLRTYLPQPGSHLCVRVVSSVCALAWWLTTGPPRKSHLRVCLLPLPALAAGSRRRPLAGWCWLVDQAPLRLSPQPPSSRPSPRPPCHHQHQHHQRGPPVSSSSDLLSFQAPGGGGEPKSLHLGPKKKQQKA